MAPTKAPPRPRGAKAIAPPEASMPMLDSLAPAPKATSGLEAQVAEAVRLAQDAATTSAHVYRQLAERMVELRLALNDLEGRTDAYREARHRAFVAGGVTDNAESARIERNVRYHIGEVMVSRNLKAPSPSRTGAATAEADVLAVRALAAMRRVRKAVDAGSFGDATSMLDALDEVEAVLAQIHRRLERESLAPTA